MIVAGIDFETTSVDPHTCHPTEFALVLWEADTNKIVEPMSFLIDVPDTIDIDNEHITGISKRLVTTYGYQWEEVQAYVLQRLVFADYLNIMYIPVSQYEAVHGPYEGETLTWSPATGPVELPRWASECTL